MLCVHQLQWFMDKNSNKSDNQNMAHLPVMPQDEDKVNFSNMVIFSFINIPKKKFFSCDIILAKFYFTFGYMLHILFIISF